MAKFGCPEKFTNMVRQFHDGMTICVQDDGAHSNPFPVTNGVKQGCVLAPTLFNMVFSAMLNDAFRNNSAEICFRYRVDGGLFNLSRLKAKTKTKTDIVRDLLFADGCALKATSLKDMQDSMDLFSLACDAFGLTINSMRTLAVYQPAPGVPTQNQ